MLGDRLRGPLSRRATRPCWQEGKGPKEDVLHLGSPDGFDLEQDLDAASVVRLCQLGATCTFSRHEHLYSQGDPAGHVFILLEGRVKATCTDPTGHETLLKIHAPQSLLGLSALRPEAVRDASGRALEDVVCTRFGRDQFLEQMRRDAALGILLVRVLLKRQQQLHSRVRDVLSNSVEQRLARALLQLSTERAVQVAADGSEVVTITHEDLAALVLSRRQYVTAIMRRFVGDGLIETRRRGYRVLDAERLATLASG